MRPLLVISLLVVLAVGLVVGLLFIGHEDRTGPRAAAAASAASDPEGSRTGPEARPADLDASGAGRSSDRAVPAGSAPASSPDPSPSKKKAAASVALTGRVVGNLGKPVEGAVVYAAERNDFTTDPLDEIDPERSTWIHRVDSKSDQDGRFEIRPEARGQVCLAVRAPAFAPLDREFNLAGAARDLGDLSLEPSVVLSGKVVDSNGRAIEHAKIARLSKAQPAFLFPGGQQRGAIVAETDARGAFRIDQLAAGPWHLLVTHEDHPDHMETGETERPGAVVPDLVFSLAEGAQIQGRIVGAPAAILPKLWIRATARANEGGVEVDNPPPFQYAPRQVRCAPDGTFLLKGLRASTPYRVAAREFNRDPFGGFRSTAVNAQSGDRGVELLYTPDTSIVFQAVDAVTGLPVVDLDVQAGWSFTLPLLDDSGRPVRRFPEGRVRYGGLSVRPSTGPARAAAGEAQSVGGLKLRIESAGYQVFERSDLAVLEGQDNDLGVVRLERAPVVAVLVLDDASSSPIADASVALIEEKPDSRDFRARVEIRGDDDSDEADPFAAGAAHRARTGPDGKASVTSLPGKSARLRVRHGGHAEYKSDVIELPLHESVDRTVRLSTGGNVTVLVADSRGAAIPGAEVDHQGPGATGAESVLSNAGSRTDGEGKVVFDHLASGTHRFRLRQEGGAGTIDVDGGRAVVRRVVRGGGAEEPGWTSVEVDEHTAETVRLVAPDKGVLAGRITEAGKALANATVRLAPRGANSPPMPFLNDGRSTHTDGTGDYQFEGADEGEYTLTVEHATRSMAYEADARLRAGDNRLDLDLPVAIVEGTVTGEDGKPVAGVRVHASRATPGGRRSGVMIAVMVNSDGGDEPQVSVGSPGLSDPESATDENGRYSLRGVLADVDLVVEANSKDAQPARSGTFSVKPDGVKKGVDLKLERGGAIQVSVQRAGKPAGGFLARAVLIDGDPVPKIQMVGPSGGAKLTGLKPGKWRVTLDPLQGPASDGAEPEIHDQEIDVKVGETAKASFDVP